MAQADKYKDAMLMGQDERIRELTADRDTWKARAEELKRIMAEALEWQDAGCGGCARIEDALSKQEPAQRGGSNGTNTERN